MKYLHIILGIFVSATVFEAKAQGTTGKTTNPSHSKTNTGTNGSANTSNNVTILRFEVLYSPVQRQTSVMWQTLTEPNNHRFEIERSINGQTFTKIGTIAGNPNSQAVLNYLFNDTNPLKGKGFYRLKQISTDSSFTYTRVISASSRRLSQAVSVSLTPNPCVSGNCDVRIANPNPTPGVTTTVQLLDDQGRTILSRNIPDTNTAVQLSASDVANRKGIFYLRIISGDETAMQRVVFE